MVKRIDREGEIRDRGREDDNSCGKKSMEDGIRSFEKKHAALKPVPEGGVRSEDT